MCKDHLLNLWRALHTQYAWKSRKSDNKASFFLNGLWCVFFLSTGNTLAIFFFLSLYLVFSRMIMLNGVYYKQNALKIRQIIYSISGIMMLLLGKCFSKCCYHLAMVSCLSMRVARARLLAHFCYWHNVPFICNILFMLTRWRPLQFTCTKQHAKNTCQRSLPYIRMNWSGNVGIHHVN